MSPPDLYWRDRAECAGTDPDVFFPHDTDTTGVRTAIAVCAGCPVREPCLAEAIESKALGVWGGTTDTDRGRLNRRAKRKATR